MESLKDIPIMFSLFRKKLDPQFSKYIVSKFWVLAIIVTSSLDFRY